MLEKRGFINRLGDCARARGRCDFMREVVARPDTPRRCTLPITALRVTPPSRPAIWLALNPSDHNFFNSSTRSSFQAIPSSPALAIAAGSTKNARNPAILAGAGPRVRAHMYRANANQIGRRTTQLGTVKGWRYGRGATKVRRYMSGPAATRPIASTRDLPWTNAREITTPLTCASSGRRASWWQCPSECDAITTGPHTTL